MLEFGEANCSSPCLSSHIDFSHSLQFFVTENKDGLGTWSMTLGKFDRFFQDKNWMLGEGFFLFGFIHQENLLNT